MPLTLRVCFRCPREHECWTKPLPLQLLDPAPLPQLGMEPRSPGSFVCLPIIISNMQRRSPQPQTKSDLPWDRALGALTELEFGGVLFTSFVKNCFCLEGSQMTPRPDVPARGSLVNACVCTHMCVCLSSCAYASVCIYVFGFICLNGHLCACIFIHTCACMCMRMHMHVCLCEFACLNARVCMCVVCMHICACWCLEGRVCVCVLMRICLHACL